MEAEQYPRYYFYEEWPVVLVETPDGGLDCLAMNSFTGEFQREMRYYRDISTKFEANVDRVSRPEFIQRVEEMRAKFLKGDEPVFALYDTIKAIKENAVEEARRLTDEERALIHTLRERTHEMFEEMLRERGLAGMPPGA